MINWTNLIVTDADGAEWGELGGIVASAPANLDNAVIEGGRITSWDGFFLSLPGQESEWEIPQADWSGFAEAIEAARA